VACIVSQDRRRRLTAVRYGAAYNDFIVHPDFESYIRKLSHSRTDFKGVWESVKDRVEVAMK
jgi:hypothetical protein